LISKIRNIVNKKGSKIKEYAINVTKNVGDVYDNLKLLNMREFYEVSFDKIKNFSRNSQEIMVVKYKNYREWVSNMKMRDALYYPSMAFEKMSAISSTSRVFVYEKVYQPTKDITIAVTSNSYNFIVTNLNDVRHFSEEVYQNIKRKYSDLSDNVRIEENEEKNAVEIIISRRILPTKKIKAFLSEVYNKISSLKGAINVFYDKTKETSIQIKENLLEKYRRFLNLLEKSRGTKKKKD